MSMPKNERYKNTTGHVNLPMIRRLVSEEGMDAAAEERIVLRICTQYPPRQKLGWIDTEFMRSRIRKIQGRKRREKTT